VKKNGLYCNGTQRWFCRHCRQSFSWRNPANKRFREQTWFKLWLMEGHSVRQITRETTHSPVKIRRIINYWLSHPPNPSSSLSQYKHLLFDGTFLSRPRCIVALMDGETNTVIAGRYGVSETSDRQLIDFFAPLIKRGLDPLSCTTDGSRTAIRVMRALWPEITIQR
jgi:hypothetical protein